MCFDADETLGFVRLQLYFEQFYPGISAPRTIMLQGNIVWCNCIGSSNNAMHWGILMFCSKESPSHFSMKISLSRSMLQIETQNCPFWLLYSSLYTNHDCCKNSACQLLQLSHPAPMPSGTKILVFQIHGVMWLCWYFPPSSLFLTQRSGLLEHSFSTGLSDTTTEQYFVDSG